MASVHRIPRPAVPVHPIEPGAGRVLNARELWGARDLVYFLTLRDIKIRYTQTALGVGWAVAQPLLLVVVFTAVVGRLGDVASDGIGYPLFALAGLLPWTFFSNAISRAAESLVTSSNMVSKVYFPRIAIPLGAVLAWLPDLAVATVLLAAVAPLLGTNPAPTILLLPVVAAWGVAMALGFAAFLSALNVRYRDIRNVVPFLVQVWLFVTPVIYPVTAVRGGTRILLGLNPVSGFVSLFRSCALGTPCPWDVVGLSMLSTVMVMVSGFVYFRRVEHRFADVI